MASRRADARRRRGARSAQSTARAAVAASLKTRSRDAGSGQRTQLRPAFKMRETRPEDTGRCASFRRSARGGAASARRGVARRACSGAGFVPSVRLFINRTPHGPGRSSQAAERRTKAASLLSFVNDGPPADEARCPSGRADLPFVKCPAPRSARRRGDVRGLKAPSHAIVGRRRGRRREDAQRHRYAVSPGTACQATTRWPCWRAAGRLDASIDER